MRNMCLTSNKKLYYAEPGWSVLDSSHRLVSIVHRVIEKFLEMPEFCLNSPRNSRSLEVLEKCMNDKLQSLKNGILSLLIFYV